MRLMLLVFAVSLIYSSTFAQEVSILSWNIKHLGKSKDDNEISFIAEVMRDYDNVAISSRIREVQKRLPVSSLNSIEEGRAGIIK